MQLEIELGIERLLAEGAKSELGYIEQCCGCHKENYIWCYIPVCEDKPNMYSNIHACFCKKCYDERDGDYYNREHQKISKIQNDIYKSRVVYGKRNVLTEKKIKKRI